jgi:hypothetical protein
MVRTVLSKEEAEGEETHLEVSVSRTASASKSVVTSVTFDAAGVPLNGLRHVKSGETLIGPPRARRSADEVNVRAGGRVLIGV